MRAVTIYLVAVMALCPFFNLNGQIECDYPPEPIPFISTTVTTTCGDVFDLCMDFYNIANTKPDTFLLNVFSNDVGSIDYCASDSVAGASTVHGKIIRLPNCQWAYVPDASFSNIDSFDYELVINDSCLEDPDYCDSGKGKIWTIYSRYEGSKTVDSITVSSRHGQNHYNVPVQATFPLNTGEYFFANGKSLSNNSNWTFTFHYSDETTEDVDVHTSCSAPIFGLTHPVDAQYNTIGNVMTPVSGCVATPGTQSVCIGDPQHLGRQDIKTRAEITTQFVDTTRVYIISNNTILPITLGNFSVESMETSNLVKWNVESVKNEDFLTLEKSYNGKDFFKLKSFEEIRNGNYNYKDSDIRKALNYYRLAITDYNGSVDYSDILLNRRPEVSRSLNIFPLPAYDDVTITVDGLPGGVKISKVNIYDISGKAITTLNEVNAQELSLLLTDYVARAGIYMVRVELSDGDILVDKLIKR